MRNIILTLVVMITTTLALSCHHCQDQSTTNPSKFVTKEEAKTMAWDAASVSDAKSSVYKILAFGESKDGEPVHIGSGTAFAITPVLFVTAGHVITGPLHTVNNHDKLVDNKLSFAITGSDGSFYGVVLTKTSKEKDLGFFLCPEASAIPIKTGAIFDAQKGDRVCVLSAAGHSLKGTRTFCGEILRVDGSGGDTLAEIYVVPGFSGSPVINRRGELVGVVTATSRFEKTGIFIPVEVMIQELIKISQS